LSTAYKAISLDPATIGLSGYNRIRDLWRQQELESAGGLITGKIPPHGVLLLKFSKR
jgi:alpha-galactosidase